MSPPVAKSSPQNHRGQGTANSAGNALAAEIRCLQPRKRCLGSVAPLGPTLTVKLTTSDHSGDWLLVSKRASSMCENKQRARKCCPSALLPSPITPGNQDASAFTGSPSALRKNWDRAPSVLG